MTQMTQKKLIGILSIVLVMLMMLCMQTINTLKLALLVPILLYCLKKARVHRKVVFLCSFLCLSTLWGCMIGLFRNTEYPFYSITVGILWPVFSLIISSVLLKTEKDFKALVKWMFVMHVFLMVYDTVFALSVIQGFPMINLYPETESAFSFYDTMARMNFDNLNVLTFTTPLFFILWITRYEFGVSRKIQTLVILFNFFFLIFCGRRSLVAVFLLTPIFAIFIRKSLPAEIGKASMKYLVFFIVIIIGAISYIYVKSPDVFESNVQNFTNAFDSDVESTKFVQQKMLWAYFQESPITGKGSGAVFYEPARGIKQHQWELTYFLLLATRGIIGFVLYLIGVAGVLFVGLKYAKNNKDILYLSMLFAYFFILLADATNPVLCSFDLMLPLYLVYAKLNMSLLSKNCIYEK